jgi:hypothetical protein
LFAQDPDFPKNDATFETFEDLFFCEIVKSMPAIVACGVSRSPKRQKLNVCTDCVFKLAHPRPKDILE